VAKVYRGLLQPYTAYVPDAVATQPATPHPLDVLLHCLNCTHDVYFSSSWPGMARLGDDQGRVVVTPLAYGEGGHYEGEAEWDVFEVLADISSRVAVDPERIDLSGMSMGSLGTFRLGLLYPDLWARTFGVGNYTTPFCVTPLPAAPTCVLPFNYYDVLDNARNLPMAFVNGGADELTPVTQTQQITQRLDALGYAWRFWLFPARTHDPSLVGQTSELTSGWLGTARRLAHPQQVTYRRLRATEDAGYALQHDRAYWLSGLVLAPGVASGDIDAVSGNGEWFTTTPVSGSGADAAGLYTVSGNEPHVATAQTGNSLALTTSGFSSLRVDTAGASLCAGAPLMVRTVTDRPTTVTVDGYSPFTAPQGTTARTLAPLRPVTCRHAQVPASSESAGTSPVTAHLPLAATGASTEVPAAALALLTAAALVLWTRRGTRISARRSRPAQRSQG
jgi:pimeloyl-ACP methyl ester carboxylesterase